MKNLTFVLIALSFLYSCDKEIDIPTIGYKKQLVVNSIIKVNKPIVLYFSYTSKTDEVYQHIEDTLHIKIYESTRLVYSGAILSDSLRTNILASSNAYYKVCVQTTGMDSITAIDTIPRQIQISDATVNRNIGVADEYGVTYSEDTFTFTDPANERNYYEVIFDNDYSSVTNITDPVLINEGDINYYPSTCFFSDELFNGQTYTMRLKFYGNSERKIRLRSISRNYYLYRKYLTRHMFTQTRSDGEIAALIIFSEPINMFTNVDGGYGIVAGYYETSPYTLREL